MAAIRERIDENGQKSYQAQVRIQGYPPRSKTFLRKTDAKKWAVQTETEIRTGMHIRQSQAGKHTAKEMLEKYTDEKLGDKAGKGKDQRTRHMTDEERESLLTACRISTNRASESHVVLSGV